CYVFCYAGFLTVLVYPYHSQSTQYRAEHHQRTPHPEEPSARAEGSFVLVDDPKLAGGVPVVHPVEPMRIRAICAGEELDRVDIVVVEVVVKDRLAHVAGRAVMDEVPGRREDGVVRVHDVAAVAPVRPRSGQELHRSHCVGRRWSVDAAEVALDEVDGGQVAGVDAVAPLGFVVEGAQRVNRRGVDVGMIEMHVDQVVLVDAGEYVKRVQSRDRVVEGSRQLRREKG